MKISNLLRFTEALSVAGPTDADVTGVALDSRQVREGALFVALPGLHVDGRKFIGDAVERGAAAIVTEGNDVVSEAVCAVQVADARLALAELACAFHGNPSCELEVIGITGTNGKTSTAYMVRDILRAAGRAPGLVSTVEYEIGARTIPALRTTPEAPDLQSMLAQMRGAGCTSAVMEVSSHSLSQQRVHGIDFDVALFTNLTHDHLDYHGSMEEYFEAKARLFRNLGRGNKTGAAIVNMNDPRGSDMLAACPAGVPSVTFGTGHGVDICAEDPVVGPESTQFHARTPWGDVPVRLELLGRFNVDNALGALAVGGVLGVDIALIGEVLSSVNTVPGRLEHIATDRGFDVFVDYAHTDDALLHVLQTLREITSGQLIVVFGCGGDRDRSKRPAMGRVASREADVIVLTSDNPRSEEPAAIIEEIREGIEVPSHVTVIEDRAEAIHVALSGAEPGDVVLVAGKGHENFQEFANRTLPFDDRQVVRTWLEDA